MTLINRTPYTARVMVEKPKPSCIHWWVLWSCQERWEGLVGGQNREVMVQGMNRSGWGRCGFGRRGLHWILTSFLDLILQCESTTGERNEYSLSHRRPLRFLSPPSHFEMQHALTGTPFWCHYIDGGGMDRIGLEVTIVQSSIGHIQLSINRPIHSFQSSGILHVFNGITSIWQSVSPK